MKEKILISSPWELKLHNSNEENINSIFTEEWIKAEVPGTVHTDLLNAKLIDDPFYADNENQIEWISKCDWIYRTNFSLPLDIVDSENSYLIFEGVDTIAKIYLNDQLLGRTENMFLKYEFDVGKIVKEKNNELIIIFHSPIRSGKELEEKHGKLDLALNSERAYLRKAQYSYGWDWGPSFPTMGIWKPVYLIKKDRLEIEDVQFVTEKISGESAEVKLNFSIIGDLKRNDGYVIRLSHKEQNFLEEKLIDKIGNQEITFEIDHPYLWQPNGIGKPNLYELKIELQNSDTIIDQYKQDVGIRTIELNLENEGEHDFSFIVNGERIFAKGVNWIPADSFLPRITDEKYEQLLQYAKNGNMNMVRVWGGGIYENDLFYKLCDEFGLLVWQDFMFACGEYPEYSGFIDNVIKEIEYNVGRLRNHPSLAIWCGNNENEWGWAMQQLRAGIYF